MKITSFSNPRIKSLSKLSRRSDRISSGLMPVEGLREISRALDAGVEIVDAYYCPRQGGAEGEAALVERLTSAGVHPVEVSAALFGKIAYRGGAGGVVAVARITGYPLDGLRPGDDPLLLVVDRLEKPGNLGAVFRTADGAGATGVIISDPSTDLSNPNVTRASLGTVFTVPKAMAPAEEVIPWLRKKGIAILASSPDAEVPYTSADMARSCAIVLGSEDEGLGDEWLKAADVRIRIPMRGRADSLNVSATAAIFLYEALRQRTQAGG